MQQIATQAIVFGIIGALVYVLARLLGCRSSPHAWQEPRRAVIRAVPPVLATAIGLCLFAVWSHAGGRSPKTAWFILVMLTIGLVVYVLPPLFGIIRYREGLNSAGVGRQNLWQACVIGLLLAVLACCNRPQDLLTKVANLTPGYCLPMLFFYGTVGFGEEFVFRGYLQTRLVAWLGAFRGWILAAAVFLLVHLPHRLLVQNLNTSEAFGAIATLMPSALFLGFVMLRTQNIVASGMFHTLLNWASEFL